MWRRLLHGLGWLAYALLLLVASLLLTPVLWSHYLVVLAAALLAYDASRRSFVLLALTSWAISPPHGVPNSTLIQAGALAATEVIHQQGRAFSTENMTIKKGATLTFLNDDSVPHNIMSTSKGNEFNLGSQLPGSSTDVTFKESGEVQVICAIHPRMKMTVKVTD